jgi:hypothetical protein
MSSSRARQLLLALLVLSNSASTAVATGASPTLGAKPPAANDCIVTVGARSFDLSELGAAAGGVRHVSQAPESRGWTYSFAACGGDATPSAAGVSCAAAPPSAVLQQTLGECISLGTSSARILTTGKDNGLALRFYGGRDGRSVIIMIECGDVARPQVERWEEGAEVGSYVAHVRARAGCSLECARTNGSVCGGKERGTCLSIVTNGSVLSQCDCVFGREGKACARNVQSPNFESLLGLFVFENISVILVIIFCVQ